MAHMGGVVRSAVADSSELAKTAAHVALRALIPGPWFERPRYRR